MIITSSTRLPEDANSAQTQFTDVLNATMRVSSAIPVMKDMPMISSQISAMSIIAMMENLWIIMGSTHTAISVRMDFICMSPVDDAMRIVMNLQQSLDSHTSNTKAVVSEQTARQDT